MIQFLLYFFIFCLYFQLIASDCSSLNYCNGHGKCFSSTSKCQCYDGWGSDTDISYYKTPDCSKRVCPAGKAWADIPTISSSSDVTAHALMECSNRGKCNRETGQCSCFPGFEGNACQRMSCPNNCSGHGQCLSIRQLARMDDAFPLSLTNYFYEGEDDGSTWDEDMAFGCLCDSSWEVGLGSGQVQSSEWFGADCSLRRCPSNDNPRTVADETDCEGVIPRFGTVAGQSGNKCHVDCSNQGICDYKTGQCQCFNGQRGFDCSIADSRAIYPYWDQIHNH